jgi:hypothetical protein
MSPVITNWDPGRAGGQPSAALPALLLPVRIETRFMDPSSGPELWLRIYPDQIAVDTHEPELSPAEEKAGRDYWEARWKATNVAQRKAAWQLLGTVYGPERASWIAAAMRPGNVGSGDPAPQFPELAASERRAGSWERVPLARGLPDRWTVALLGTDSQTYRRVHTPNPVRSELALGLDPKGQLEEDPTGAQVDARMRWMLDFDEAVAAGMAVRIPLSAAEREKGFERVIVFGLHGGDGAGVVTEMLRAHRFTDGLAFVPQGTPTNNTADHPTGYSRKDPGLERSFALEERGQVELPDASVAAAALGVQVEAFEDVEHADGDGERNAREMAVALWPATLGYFLSQMMADRDPGSDPSSLPSYHPLLSSEQEDEARSWFIERVRGRGPLPAIRVGDTPYGLLPVTSGELWNQRTANPTARRVAALLRRRTGDPVAASKAPRIAPGGDPEQQLVQVLGFPPTSTSYRIRHAAGEELLVNWQNFLRVDGAVESFASPAGDSGDQGGSSAFVDRAAALGFLAFWGLSELDPRVGHTAISDVTHPLPFPVAQDGPLSETEGLATFTASDGSKLNYISWLRHASVDDLRENRYPGGKPPKALLYQVLRQSLLLEYANQAFTAQISTGQMMEADRIEPELVGFHAQAAPAPGENRERRAERREGRKVKTAWDALDKPVTGVTRADQTMAEYLGELQETEGTPYSRLGELWQALDHLGGLPTAELDRLFRETVDVCSHRFDAWITSVASDTLAAKRASQPHGVHVGAFGWIEALTPAERAPTPDGDELALVEELDRARRSRAPEAPEPPPARQPREDSGGFIHAPSIPQAVAAAVLRNGYLTHVGTASEGRLAVDLSSHRVRLALDVLECVRQGQPLGALLGYRFERGLHEGGLAEHVAFFRDRYPALANKLTKPPVQPAEAVAASNVTDGLALYRDWSSNKAGWSGFPSGESASTFTPLLEELEDVMDALGDLSISESVFQLTRGNYGRAGGLPDALSRGERPPEPEVVGTPRGGVDLTHRLFVLLMGDPARSTAWGGAPANPRAKAESRLDAWISTLLPNPASVRARVRSVDGAGTVQTVDVTLAALRADPLDLLFMADAADAPQSSELEQRLLYEALGSLPPDPGEVSLIFDRTAAGLTAGQISFPELLVLVRQIRDLVGGARPLAPEDLAEPAAVAATASWPLRSADPADAGDLDTRASEALKALDQAAKGLDSAITAASPSASQLRQRLVEASWLGVLTAIPATRKPTDPKTVAALIDQAKRVGDELQKRRREAQEKDTAFDRAAATPQELRDHLVGLIEAAFGASFPALPQFRPSASAGADLQAAFGQSSSLLDGDHDAPRRWLQELALVRDGASRLDAAESLAQLLGAGRPPELTLGQLPRKTPDRWLGLPLKGTDPPEPGRVSLAGRLSASYDPTAWHSGLLVDEWPERIPAREETTGLVFHYDQPSARSPQSLLLAVCPDMRPNWDEDALFSILRETFDLAAVRLENVDDWHLDDSQFLPALWFAFNPDGDTVSVDGWSVY